MKVRLTAYLLAPSAADRVLADRAAASRNLAAFPDASEHEAPAYIGFTAQHRRKPRSTNPIGRLSKEAKRRADVAGIFPGENGIAGPIGAVLQETDDEWAVQNRCMQVEAIVKPGPPLIEGEITSSDAVQTTPKSA